MANVKAVIVSLWDYPFHVERSFGSYNLPARPDNGKTILDQEFTESYSTLEVQDAKEGMDIGEKRRIQMKEGAQDIAQDIVKNDDIEKFGCFVAAGMVPTDKELQLARARILAFFRFLIQDGDVKWGKPTTRNEITDLHRKAVKELGESREWVYKQKEVTVPLDRCPACGKEQEIEDPAICWNCRTILSKKKAAQLGIIQGELVGRK
jgi:hypothetical protein